MKQKAAFEVRAQSGHYRYWPILKSESQNHRKAPTPSERKVWFLLLRNNQTGYRFVRQKPLGRFILDFYGSELLLAIEIDGESHFQKQNYDQEKDNYLKHCGILTIRYKNYQVINNIDWIKKDLGEKISIREMEF